MIQATQYIRLGSDPSGQVKWLSRGPQGGSAVRSGELQEAALRGQGERLCILLPAESILPLRAALPALQGQRLRLAVPFAVEEQLAEDVEGYHYALGKRDGEGQLPLLALRRDEMSGWQAQLAAVELRPHACYDEAQLLPWRPGELSLLLEPQGALLRLSAHEGYSVPLDGLDVWLELALERAPQEVTVLRLYDARGEGAPPLALHGALAGLELHTEAVAEPLSLLASGNDGTAIDLLQGEFSRKEQLGRLWRPWRASLALLGAWLLLLTVETLYDYFYLRGEEARLFQASRQVYLDTFPEAKSVSDPRGQMETKLKALQGGGSGGPFIELLSRSGPVVNGIKGAQVQNMRYRQGELELELQLADLPALDALKGALQQQGLEVEIRNATSRDERVEARVAIRGAAR